MAIDERRRVELFERLDACPGPEATETMMEMLPSSGATFATSDDVAFVAKDLSQFSRDVDRRFEQVDRRFDALEQRMDERFGEVDLKLDALRGTLLAAFRGELVSAVSGQTRAVIVATATATFGIGGLAVTLAQLL